MVSSSSGHGLGISRVSALARHYCVKVLHAERQPWDGSVSPSKNVAGLKRIDVKSALGRLRHWNRRGCEVEKAG